MKVVLIKANFPELSQVNGNFVMSCLQSSELTFFYVYVIYIVLCKSLQGYQFVAIPIHTL